MLRTLFLSDTVPWPPNTGRYQRVYHLLKAVSAVGDVTLICPTPGGRITTELEALRPLCSRVFPFPGESFAYRRDATLPRYRRIVRALLSALDPREPSLLSCTRSEAATNLVAQLCQDNHFDVVWVERLISLSMLPVAPCARVIVDLDDVEHRRLAHKLRSTPPTWRAFFDVVEFLKLRHVERRLLGLPYEFAVCSAIDQRVLGDGSRVHVIPNGVTVPTSCARRSTGAPVFLFVGSMSLPANIDAVFFFTRHILPQIRRSVPGARFIVAGHEPPAALQRLHDGVTVTVTGSVPAVEPYLREAAMAVVPLRFGGGTRLKILEAMAHGTPVVSTTIGAEGLDVEPGQHLLIADGAERFARACVALLQNPSQQEHLARAAYRLVRERYDWRHIEALVQRILSARGFGSERTQSSSAGASSRR